MGGGLAGARRRSLSRNSADFPGECTAFHQSTKHKLSSIHRCVRDFAPARASSALQTLPPPPPANAPQSSTFASRASSNFPTSRVALSLPLHRRPPGPRRAAMASPTARPPPACGWAVARRPGLHRPSFARGRSLGGRLRRRPSTASTARRPQPRSSFGPSPTFAHLPSTAPFASQTPARRSRTPPSKRSRTTTLVSHHTLKQHLFAKDGFDQVCSSRSRAHLR